MNAEQLTRLFEPVVASLGLECLGVEFVASRGSGLVRVYIDVEGRHVTVDDCEAVSREVSAALDVNDPISGRYTLEVSSPGFDRPLFTPAQFARFVGESAKVSVNLAVNGRRRFQGQIVRVESDIIVLALDGADFMAVFRYFLDAGQNETENAWRDAIPSMAAASFWVIPSSSVRVSASR